MYENLLFVFNPIERFFAEPSRVIWQREETRFVFMLNNMPYGCCAIDGEFSIGLVRMVSEPSVADNLCRRERKMYHMIEYMSLKSALAIFIEVILIMKHY